jgi:hypothetical protein
MLVVPWGILSVAPSRKAQVPEGAQGCMSNGNGTKTDAIIQAVTKTLEGHRKELDAAHWDGSSTVAIIVRLRKGEPQRVSFRTEAESDFFSNRA